LVLLQIEYHRRIIKLTGKHMIQIKMKDGAVLDLAPGSTARDVAEKLNLKNPHQALAAEVNGRVVDLVTPLSAGDTVQIINFEDPIGKEVFWHTSAHLLAQAVLRLHPQAQPTIGPPIDNGFYYDFANLTISDDDFEKIEEEMKKIVKENYPSIREELKDKHEALKAFGANPFKAELIRDLPEGEKLTAYRQGEFYDLCRGPHLPNLGKIKALKIMKTSGAYWRGDSNREMLTRIYGTTFPDRLMLKSYLEMLEEAKKRDHKVLGPKLDLFSIHDVAPGMPFIHPAGMHIWTALTEYLREKLKANDYIEIKTPALLSRELWETSGHWANYRDNMYTTETENKTFAIKPMNCPGCMIFYGTHLRSYRDLPLRVAEIGNVHRHEPSGAVSGLFRVRSFHQDDAHIFMKPSDIESEIIGVLKFADELYRLFGLEYRLELSTRPEKNTIGSDEDWDVATKGLKAALDHSKKEYRINEGDGAFYGPKIDFHIKDAINRTWQCGTIQLDMALPERFGLEYVDDHGDRKRPIMIHRAIFGSIERFFGILIEHFAGKFPLWLSPRQIRILTVADRHEPYANELCAQFKAHGFQCAVDASSESVSKKVRDAQISQVNYILTVGDQETESRTVNLRTRDNVVHGQVNVAEFMDKISHELKERSLVSPYHKE
jgi:threonyl-tRNA synthetase